MREAQDKILRDMESVERGDKTSLDAWINLKAIAKEAEQLIKDVKAWETENKDQIIAEAREYPDGYRGFLFEIRSGATRLSFTGIEEVSIKKAELKAVEEKYRTAWKSYQKGLIPVDAEGEVLELPTASTGADVIILKPLK